MIQSASAPGAANIWVRQDQVDRGELTGVSTTESIEVRAARERIRELEAELAIVRRAAKFLGQGKPLPNGFTR